MASGRARLMGIFSGMKTRCYNKNRKDYPRYGGRGIRVCDEWMDSNGFELFYQWSMLNGYDDSLTIDRIDGDGWYSPKNCRWASPSEQSSNRSNNHLIEYGGKTKTLKEWADTVGLRKDTLRRRIENYGWSIEDALTVPNMKGRTSIGHEKWKRKEQT